MSVKVFLLISIIFILSGQVSQAQYYWKLLESPNDYFRMRSDLTATGDLFIADSFLAAQRTGGNGQLFLSKIDQCGAVLWNRSYELADYLELKDIVVNENGDCYLYGSAYQGLQERIFLLKTNVDGDIQRFHLFEPETVDHFTYQLDWKNGRLLAYGLLLDFNTQKQGFIAVFDEELNLQWSKKFAPFDSNGLARFTDGGDIVCWSGNNLFKIDKDGQWSWGRQFNSEQSARLLSGPFRINEQYVFHVGLNDNTYLFSIDEGATLQWQTFTFSAADAVAFSSFSNSSQHLLTYPCTQNGQTSLCYRLLDNDGNLSKANIAQLNRQIQFRDHTQWLHQDSLVAVVANADPFAGANIDVKDFVLQFDINDSVTDCFEWETLNEGNLATDNIILTPFDTIVNDMVLMRSDAETLRNTIYDKDFFTGICSDFGNKEEIIIDTLLSCKENWIVTLPDGFRWEDGTREKVRTLEVIGSYPAVDNRDCGEVLRRIYELNKTPCTCDAYLPTAFSPNADGENDVFSLAHTCNIISFDMQIYDRWGNRIFQSDQEKKWDGTTQQQDAPIGLYLVHINYQWKDEEGGVFGESLTQSFYLIR